MNTTPATTPSAGPRDGSAAEPATSDAPPLTGPRAGQATEPEHDAPRRPVERVVLGLLAALLVAVGLWFGAVTARGGHLFIVQTPSMAQTAPVGSLVVTEKVDPSTLVTGDVITFRPPRIDRVYTHRIVEVTPAGFRTKGDLNGSPDGWVVPRDRVVGKAAHLWFGLGWLVRMAPWLALGGFLTAVARRAVKERNRAAVTIVGSALSMSLALVVVRPLLRAETTGFAPVGTDGVRISAVATGLLPIRAAAPDGGYADLVPGQLGWVETHQADSHGRFQLVPSIHLPWWGWVLLVLCCALPLIASLFVTDDHEDDPSDPDAAAGAGGPGGPAVPWWRRVGRPAAAGLATMALAAGLSPTHAALTARIQNSTNTAQTRPSFYATCLDAMRAYVSGSATDNGRLYAGYAMGNGTGVAGATDQGTVGPYTMTQVSMTQGTATSAAQTGCQTDFTARGQQYVTLNGSSSQGNLPTSSSISNITYDPGNANKLTWNTWFRTTTTRGGVLSCPGGTNDVCADRVTWMTNAGKLAFGVGSTMIVSPASYNDGAWHMVTTQISSAGMIMWVDGVRVATNSSVTGGDGIISYPQWGYSAGALKSSYSAQAPTSLYFAGDIQFAGMYGGGGKSGLTLQDADVLSLYYAAFP